MYRINDNFVDVFTNILGIKQPSGKTLKIFKKIFILSQKKYVYILQCDGFCNMSIIMCLYIDISYKVHVLLRWCIFFNVRVMVFKTRYFFFNMVVSNHDFSSLCFATFLLSLPIFSLEKHFEHPHSLNTTRHILICSIHIQRTDN